MAVCRPEARDQLHRTARALEERQTVLATDVLAPDEGPRDEWTLEVTLTTAGRVRNPVLDDVASMGMDLALPAQCQGRGAVIVATV